MTIKSESDYPTFTKIVGRDKSMIPSQAQPVYQQAPIVQQPVIQQPVIQQPIIQPVMQPQVVQQQPQVVQHTTIIEKTVEKEAEKPVVTKQPGKWSHDICGCFEDTETLLLVAFCPCSAAGEFF